MFDDRVLDIAKDVADKTIARLKEKSIDYSYKFNRLHYFQKSAEGLNLHPLTIGVTLLDKHILRLYRKFSPMPGEFDQAWLDEVLIDITSYISLLYALAVEELEQKEGTNGRPV